MNAVRDAPQISARVFVAARSEESVRLDRVRNRSARLEAKRMHLLGEGHLLVALQFDLGPLASNIHARRCALDHAIGRVDHLADGVSFVRDAHVAEVAVANDHAIRADEAENAGHELV